MLLGYILRYHQSLVAQKDKTCLRNITMPEYYTFLGFLLFFFDSRQVKIKFQRSFVDFIHLSRFWHQEGKNTGLKRKDRCYQQISWCFRVLSLGFVRASGSCMVSWSTVFINTYVRDCHASTVSCKCHG